MANKKFKYGFKLKNPRLTFRKRVVIIVVGSVIAAVTLLFTADMTRRLREKEQNEVSLWTMTLEQSWRPFINDPMLQRIGRNSSIPFVIVDQNLRVVHSNLIPGEILNHPDKLRKEIDKLSRMNKEVQISAQDGSRLFVFYGESSLLRMLRYYPLVQLSIIVIFFIFAFLTFFSSKHDEQNRVWIGLAKETAHQLGTPISSLMGWIEYLRSQPVNQSAVEEMNKDLTRLTKVADRFSKIGSETDLEPVNVNEVVGESVIYFRSRIPRNVTLDYNGLAIAPVRAMVNTALFEWVVENLLKNSLDALQGTGFITVTIGSDENDIYIDVSDTGKGIAKSNFKRIFEPGFTTKTRGWGLGLSLSKRIIEIYHKGRIAVTESEIGRGTTIRITLKRIYD